MKFITPLTFLALLITPLFAGNPMMNFLIFTLIIALSSQGWHILGGYNGQFSFGHAAFFGVGAYIEALLQVRFGVSPYLALCGAAFGGALLGFFIGFCSFRAGLKGSYFALVTLAFAEILRIITNAWSFTGGAAGIQVKLDIRPENFQFHNRVTFYYILLAFVILAYLLSLWMERSRFGARAIAIRENEQSAMALGINATSHKEQVITLSGMISAIAGAFYTQYYLYLDASIAFGTWISVESLLAPILGGLGTALGPILGAIVLQGLSELTKIFSGNIAGLDLVVYGAVLIAVVAFAPKGIMGMFNAKR